jgi:hypothetical protein
MFHHKIEVFIVVVQFNNGTFKCVSGNGNAVGMRMIFFFAVEIELSSIISFSKSYMHYHFTYLISFEEKRDEEVTIFNYNHSFMCSNVFHSYTTW